MTPAGAAGQVRPRRSESDEEAQRPPRGKQAPGAEINLSLFNSNKFAKIDLKNKFRPNSAFPGEHSHRGRIKEQ